MKATRIWLGVVVPAAWVVVAVGAFAVCWTRLPDPLATHWGWSATPNGAMPRIAAFGLFGGASVLAAIAARVAMHRERGIAHLAGAAAFSGVLFAALGVLTVVANLGAARWQDARGVGIPLALACCGLAWLAAALVSRAARTLERAPTIGALARPTVGLGATERAVWTAGAKNRVLFIVALLVAIGGVVTWAGGAGWVTFVSCIAVAIAVTALAEAHVRVDERALTIAFGPIGLPRIRIAVDRIAHAETMTVQPMANGGWGYRGSLTALGRAAVVIRGGEGLRLALRDNKTLVVTVDDAETGAGLINDLVARRGA
ncbi:MAG: DUF1648 domain-containing protein [Deltaproteobacteria bacterium]